jgi:hypothetical protein
VQRKEYSDRYLYADIDGLDDVHQIAKFTLRGAADAAPALEAYAMKGDSVVVGGRSVGAVMENGINLGIGGDIRFSIQVPSRKDWQLISKSVITGVQIAAHHSRTSGDLFIDAMTLQDTSPRNLGEAYKSNEGDTLMKSSGTFGRRHVMTFGGGETQTEPSAALLTLINDIRKSASSNREHLMQVHSHLEKVGGHLAAAKARYPFDNNVRGAASSYEAAIESLKKIDLPPDLEQGSGKPEALAPPRDAPTFPGPQGRWNGTTTGARPDPDIITSDQPDRKMSRIDYDAAFKKEFRQTLKDGHVVRFGR